MREITGPAARSVLCDPAFVVPPVPAAATGVGWLRASVARFGTGDSHARRRALSTAVLAAIPPHTLRGEPGVHPVTTLATAMGLVDLPADLVREVAQAYQPGTGDEDRADAAVEQLVVGLGGAHDEATAARIGILVQACEATATLIDRARHRPAGEVLRDDPPVPATRRQALVATTVDGVRVEAGEIVRVGLADGLAFGAGPHACPGRDHALALTTRTSISDGPDTGCAYQQQA
jgi:hypothetical protein